MPTTTSYDLLLRSAGGWRRAVGGADHRHRAGRHTTEACTITSSKLRIRRRSGFFFIAVIAVACTMLVTVATDSTGQHHPRILQSVDDHLHDPGFEAPLRNIEQIEFGKFLRSEVISLSVSVAGHSTYQLALTPMGDADTVYAIYGHDEVPLKMPPAYQVPSPFGTNVGGASPELFVFRPEVQYDSYLFADLGGSGVQISSVGIEFAEWTATTALTTTNGAVFFMDPGTAPVGQKQMIVAQLTVATGSGFTAQCGAQGHNKPDAAFAANEPVSQRDQNGHPILQSWDEEIVLFELKASSGSPPTP